MNKNGFTLIELIISVAILSVVLLSIVSVLSTSYVQTILIGDRNTDLYLAETDVEHFLKGDSIATSTEQNYTVSVTFGSHTFNVDGRNVTISVPSVTYNGKTTEDLKIFLPD